MISKLFKNSLLGILRSLLVRIRWPVEEMGRNSVKPSTMDRTMVFKYVTSFIVEYICKKIRCCI